MELRYPSRLDREAMSHLGQLDDPGAAYTTDVGLGPRRIAGGVGLSLEHDPRRPEVVGRKKAHATSLRSGHRCEAIALVLSEAGTGRYVTLESWPLG